MSVVLVVWIENGLTGPNGGDGIADELGPVGPPEFSPIVELGPPYVTRSRARVSRISLRRAASDRSVTPKSDYEAHCLQGRLPTPRPATRFLAGICCPVGQESLSW